MKRNFVPVFLFSPFCRKYVQILGRIFGIYQISQAGAAHRTKAGQKNCRQEPSPKPAACKKPAAQTDSRKWFCAVFDLPIYVMKSHMFCADFFDDPVVKSAEAVRIPRFACAWRWEQIRIRRVTFMFFREKLCRILREKNRSDGIWRFWRADDQFPILPRDAFVDRECTVLNTQVLPP